MLKGSTRVRIRWFHRGFLQSILTPVSRPQEFRLQVYSLMTRLSRTSTLFAQPALCLRKPLMDFRFQKLAVDKVNRDEKLPAIKLTVVQYGILIMMLVLWGGLWRLQVLGGDSWRVLAEQNRIRK